VSKLLSLIFGDLANVAAVAAAVALAELLVDVGRAGMGGWLLAATLIAAGAWLAARQ